MQNGLNYWKNVIIWIENSVLIFYGLGVSQKKDKISWYKINKKNCVL